MHIEVFDTYFTPVPKGRLMRSAGHDDLCIIVEEALEVVTHSHGDEPRKHWAAPGGKILAEVRGVRMHVPRQFLTPAVSALLQPLRPPMRSDGIAFVMAYRNFAVDGAVCTFDVFPYAVLHQYDHGPDVVPVLDVAQRSIFHSKTSYRDLQDSFEYPWNARISTQPLQHQED